jgi:hypothetical protein
MKISTMVVAAMCFAMLNTPAFATSYYMSGGGNDANSGLTGTAAFKSVSKMNAQAFVCGDRIYVDGSSAPTADATLHISGPNSASGLFPQNLSTSTCASSPIIIDTYNATCTFSSADPPVPSGCGTLTPPSGKHGIFIDNASGVTVQNIAVVGSGADTATTYGIMFTNSDWYGQTSPPSGITYDHLTADHNYVTGFDTLIRVQEIVGADKLDTVTISNNALVGTTGLETEGIRVQGQMGAACCYSPNGPQGQLTNTNFDIHGNYVTNVQGRTGGPGGVNGNGIIVGEVNGG